VVEIAIKSDNILEPDETFSLNLSEPINAVLGSATAPGVIIDPGSVALRAASLSTKPGPLLQASFHQGALRIRFQTLDGERYALEWTQTGGLMRADWRPVAGAAEIIGNGLIMEVTDAEAAARPQAFYRVRRLP
jgi:hypothetical protein